MWEIFLKRWKGKEETDPAGQGAHARLGGGSWGNGLDLPRRTLESWYWHVISPKNVKICAYKWRVLSHQLNAAHSDWNILMAHFPCSPRTNPVQLMRCEAAECPPDPSLALFSTSVAKFTFLPEGNYESPPITGLPRHPDIRVPLSQGLLLY